MTKSVSRLANLRSGLGSGFILSTVVLVLCKLWRDYYEGRQSPLGTGDRDLTLAVFNGSAVLSMCTLVGFLVITALLYVEADDRSP